MLRALLKLVVVALALIGLVAVVGAGWFAAGGISSRGVPSQLETIVARAARTSAIPRDAKARVNPLQNGPDVVRAGLEHFADHCATCHANDGSGDTLYGRGMYPRPPDLRLEPTQKLSDGELFYIIENGVKLTGMPAFGDGKGDGASSWGLVHFIRHLPKLSPEELKRMEALNPKPPSDHDAKPHKH